MSSRKKKIVYIVALTDSRLINSESSGIKKKIDWQVAAMENAGLDIDLIKKPVLSKAKRVLPFQSSTIDWKNLLDEMLDKYDGLYHRYVYSDYQMVNLFSLIKAAKPGFKIILEIPTYPYDRERRKNLLQYRDWYYRSKLHKYVDRIVIFDKWDSVWGIPTIPTQNGINLQSVSVKKQLQRHDGIDICMIADFEYWHGVDRLLQGLIDYYENEGKEDIRIHLVGGISSSNEIQKCRKFASNDLIKNRVFFYGNLVGTELDHIYDICHVAVASLGRHRTGTIISSEIKTREYMGKGIPFIYSTEIDVFREAHVDFAYQLSINDDPVNMDEVTGFYHNLCKNCSAEQLTDRIRRYAEKTVSMDMMIKPIADFFLSG